MPVPFEDEQPKAMPDKHFVVSLKDRLRLDVCPSGCVCQHRREDGTSCGAPLDGRGGHAKKCQVGPTKEARRNALRDFTASLHPKVTGYSACPEQRVVAWDRIYIQTGVLEEARLDVATRDAGTGHKIYVDTCDLRSKRLRAASAGSCRQRWRGRCCPGEAYPVSIDRGQLSAARLRSRGSPS